MKKILVCPVCKSSDVVLDVGGYTGKYMCKNCGYVGIALEMTEGEFEQLEKSEKIAKEMPESKSKKHEDEEHKTVE